MGNGIANLDELRTYAAIVEEGSLAAAATELGVTPNAVSRRLAVLEERLGRRLIHRTTRKLSVTDEGRTFHARCRRALDELDEAERELASADGTHGTLRIGVHSDMLGPSLMAALGHVLERNRELSIELRVGFDDPIAAGLDLAIYVGQPPSSSLTRVSLGSLVWSLAAAPAYVQARGEPTTPDDLCDHECLRIRRDRRETHWRLRPEGGRARRFAIGGRFESTDGRALAAALYAGLGIGVRLRSEIGAAAHAGTLVPVLPAWQWAATPVFALAPKGRTRLPAVRAVLDALRRATKTLGG